MILTRTSVRLSLCGGGTDYPAWWEVGENEGLVLGGAIDSYSYLHVRHLPPFHPGVRTRVAYSEIELAPSNNDIRHRVVREAIRECGLEEEGLEILHCSDTPSKSGLGSSSAFTVGLLHALSSLKGQLATREELARRAIALEQGALQESVGCQDQLLAALGGLRILRFSRRGHTAEPLPLSQGSLEALEAHLHLFFTGASRRSSDIASTYVQTLAGRPGEQWAMVRLAERAISAVVAQKYEELASLVDQSFRIKAGLSEAACPQAMSALYARARLAGAWGGKLTGAGGGGSLLLVAPPEKRERLARAMKEEGCVAIPFRFDFSGSTLLFSERRR